MHLIKLTLFLIVCIGFNDAGFMDRFKSSYNWIYKVDYKVNLWPLSKKVDNSTLSTANNGSTTTVDPLKNNSVQNSTENHVNLINQTESSAVISSTDHSESSLTNLVSNQTETILSSTMLIVNQTDFYPTINQTESSSIILNTSIAMNDSVKDDVSNLKFTKFDSLKEIQISTNVTESDKSIETTTELLTTVKDFEHHITNKTDTIISNLSTELENFSVPTEATNLINEVNDVNPSNLTSNSSTELSDILKTSKNETSTKLTKIDMKMPQLINDDIIIQEITTISPVSIEKIKPPVETSSSSALNVYSSILTTTESITTLEDKNQTLNHTDSVEPTTESSLIVNENFSSTEIKTTTETSLTKISIKNMIEKNSTVYNETEAINMNTTKKMSTPVIDKQQDKTSPTIAPEQLITTSTIPTIKTTKKVINKSNTPIIIKFLNLKTLTPGRRMKNKEGEDDNLIYKDLHTYNYFREKLDEAFVKFINTFYFNRRN